jgi:hypothetical protein
MEPALTKTRLALGLGIVAVVIGGAAWAQSSNDGFLDAPPLYQSIDYSAIHYRYKDMAVQPGTGYALFVFEEFDPVTDRATGRVVMQRRIDTGLAVCVVTANGITVPTECVSGATIR